MICAWTVVLNSNSAINWLAIPAPNPPQARERAIGQTTVVIFNAPAFCSLILLKFSM
jgi:hypothetical protein